MCAGGTRSRRGLFLRLSHEVEGIQFKNYIHCFSDSENIRRKPKRLKSRVGGPCEKSKSGFV
jgi:hypothetical protein